jgi:hypothetical protein
LAKELKDSLFHLEGDANTFMSLRDEYLSVVLTDIVDGLVAVNATIVMNKPLPSFCLSCGTVGF